MGFWLMEISFFVSYVLSACVSPNINCIKRVNLGIYHRVFAQRTAEIPKEPIFIHDQGSIPFLMYADLIRAMIKVYNNLLSSDYLENA